MNKKVSLSRDFISNHSKHTHFQKSYDKEEVLLFIFLASLFLLGFVIPVIVYPIPTGTDVYTHMFYTEEIAKVNSLNEFYEKCSQSSYLGCDYPFGIRIFGAILSKITGLGIFEISYILPLILLPITILIFYVYSGLFLDSRKLRLLSSIFFITMTNIALDILGYVSSTFSIPILISILYFTFNENISVFKKIVPLIVLIFFLVITHTGTYIFLISFVMVFLLVSAILFGKFDRDVYILLMGLLVIYTISIWVFPYIQPQYLDKARLFVTVGNFISEKIQVPIISSLSQLFYQRVFVENEIIDAILWSTLFYVVIEMITLIHLEIIRLKPFKKGVLATIPIIGGIKNMSHSLLATPFWIGPFQTFFSIFGMFRLNKRGFCILISSIFVLLIPGGLNPGPTGALREIFYFIIIIPITAALGFEYIFNKIGKSNRKKIRKLFLPVFFLLVFPPLLIIPILGNLYYRLDISGTDYERMGMIWLSGVGNENEGVSGYGYRHMISIYSNKIDPSATTVSYGNEMSRFNDDLRNIYFGENSKFFVYDIFTNYNVRYFINSEQVLKNFGRKSDDLKINYNSNLDKIYSSRGDFSIYSYIQPTYTITKYNETHETNIKYREETPKIEDAGYDYIIETDSYRTVISKTKPTIKYLGTSGFNYLGEGMLDDYLTLYWLGGSYHGTYNSDFLSNLNYSYSLMYGNQISYQTTLKDGDGKEWADIIIKFSFFEYAIKKEVIIANDRMNFQQDAQLHAILSSRQFLPMNYFIYYYNEIAKKKVVYPSEDSVDLNENFNSIFINDGNKGIYIEYEKTSPNPDKLVYKGSTIYNYSQTYLYSDQLLDPSDSMYITQYLSIGDETVAKKNVEKYTSTSLLLYPGINAPILLVGYLDAYSTNDYENFLSAVKVYNDFNSLNVSSYSLGIAMNKQQLSIERINKILFFNHFLLGYENLYDSQSRSYYNYFTQDKNIREMKRVADDYKDGGADLFIGGLIPSSLNFNLETIKAVDDNKLGFIIGTSVSPPYRGLYESGFRYPKFAYYMGNETDIVLIPVSMPTSSSLRPEFDAEKTITSWKDAIDATVKNDEICLFLWNPIDIDSQEYSEIIYNVTEYARSKGMSFKKPIEIEKHFKLLQNISIEIYQGIDNVNLSIRNGNNIDVNDLAFRIILPKIERNCPYTANGEMLRIVNLPTECKIYVNEDIGAGDTVLLTIKPNIYEKTFNIVFISEIEGHANILVEDQEMNPVKEATIIIDGNLFKSDENGTVNIEVRRGKYTAIIEKPGFEAKTFVMNVKGRFFSLWGYSMETYVLALVVLIMLVIVYVFREILYGHALRKSRLGLNGIRKIVAKIRRIVIGES